MTKMAIRKGITRTRVVVRHVPKPAVILWEKAPVFANGVRISAGKPRMYESTVYLGTERRKATRYKAHDGGEYRIESVGRAAGRADFQRLSKARDKRARRQVRNLCVSGMGAIDG